MLYIEIRRLQVKSYSGQVVPSWSCITVKSYLRLGQLVLH